MWQIKVNGDVVREYSTREECETIALRQYWAVLRDGALVLTSGVEITEAPAAPEAPAED